MSVVRVPVQVGPSRWDWSRTYVFGVVNVTPDSFSDGGRFYDADAAVVRGVALAGQGADAVDVGGESTRPGSEPVTADEELRRVLPVVRQLAAQIDIPVSIDTYKAEVAEAALAAGASIVNDVSGLCLDRRMASVVAATGATVIIGHLRGRPATMQQGILFDDVVSEVIEELRESVRVAVRAGVRPDRIWVDPGIGFGKRADQSVTLIRSAGRLRDEVGYPVMLGVSRKSFIGEVTGLPPQQRLIGSCAAAVAAVGAGADALRLHDVDELMPAVRVADAIRRGISGVEPTVRQQFSPAGTEIGR